MRCGLAGDALLQITRAGGKKLEISSGRGTVLQSGDVVRAVCHSQRPAYLAFSGGIQIDPVLGSRSTYLRARLGGLDGRTLQTGDKLVVGSLTAHEQNEDRSIDTGAAQQPETESSVISVRVIPGPQHDHFTQQALDLFYSTSYTVSTQADRMGLRLEGPALSHGELGSNIPSDGIVPGAIQVPADGMPIILLSDAQTTGGYTKPCVVIRADLPLLGRLVPGDRIRFVEASPQEAQEQWKAGAEALNHKLAKITHRAVAGTTDEARLRTVDLSSGLVSSQHQSQANACKI